MREKSFYEELNMPNACEILLMHKEVYDKKTAEHFSKYCQDSIIERYERHLNFLERHHNITKEISFAKEPYYDDYRSSLFKIKDNIDWWYFVYSVGGYRERFLDKDKNIIGEVNSLAWFEYSIERIKETNSCICRELVFELGIKDIGQFLIAIIVVLGTLCIMNAMQNNFSMNHFTTYLAILYMIFFYCNNDKKHNI